MTHDEQQMAKALGLVTMCPGIGTKRFAKDMAWRAEHLPEPPLTERQQVYLATAVIRFRRQIPAEVVSIARQAATALTA